MPTSILSSINNVSEGELFRTLLDKLVEEHYREVSELNAEIKHLRTCHAPRECALQFAEEVIGEVKDAPPDDLVFDERTAMEHSDYSSEGKHVCLDDVNIDYGSNDDCHYGSSSNIPEEKPSREEKSVMITIQDSLQSERVSTLSMASTSSDELHFADVQEVWHSQDTVMSSWSRRFTGILKQKSSQMRKSAASNRPSHLRPSAQGEYNFYPESCVLLWHVVPILPSAKSKVIWDLSAVVALLYDVILIPMLAFDIPMEGLSFVGILDWIFIFFWTLDLPLNFFVGYYTKDGQVVTSLSKIARRYVRGWFCADLVIIASDWLTLAMRLVEMDGASLARLGKITRVARSMRTLRLLRLIKLRKFLAIFFEVMETEWMSLMLGTVMNLFSLIGVNHGIACLWFWLGSASLPTTWVKEYGFVHAPWWDQYVTSLHWSLTQFTAASSTVTATNPQERVFSVIVLLFAIVAFSSFLSGITSAMTRLRTINSQNFSQTLLLNKFLRQNHISRNLGARITRYVHLLQSQHEAYLDANKVEYLKLLSGPLNIELQWERYMRVLKPHPFFHRCGQLGQSGMHHLCFTAVSSAFFARQDVLFDSGATSEKMYFPKNGWLFYRRPPGFKDTPKYVVVTKGQWFCENVLWTPWMHRGLMKTLIEVALVTLHVTKFHETACAHPELFSIGRRFAHAFVEAMNTPNESRPYTWDVPWEVMYPDAEQVLPTLTYSEKQGKVPVVNFEVLEAFEREAQIVDLEYSRIEGYNSCVDEGPVLHHDSMRA